MSNYIKVEDSVSWDEYFMLQAIMASFKSKDPSTKVGCVFVDNNKHQISMGYNGFVAGVDESKLPWGNDTKESFKDQKYAYVVHAEANAILHATKSLKNSRCYVTLFPCNECAKMLASCGVTEVIYLNKRDCDNNQISEKILKLSNVKIRKLTISEKVTKDLICHIEKKI